MLLCQTGTSWLKLVALGQSRGLTPMLPILQFGLRLLKHQGNHGELHMHLRSHIHINLRDSAFFGCTNRDKDGLSKKRIEEGYCLIVSLNLPKHNRYKLLNILMPPIMPTWICSYHPRFLSWHLTVNCSIWFGVLFARSRSSFCYSFHNCVWIT